MKAATLELSILSKLRDADPNLVVEVALWREVAAESALPVKRHELTAMLRAMEERKEVLSDSTLDGTKWKIASAGRMRLSEANL